MFLVGDIGGTKTSLALFKDATCHHLETYSSTAYPNLESILQVFLKERVEAACFAIAGPIKKGICHATNLPWVVDAAALSTRFKIPKVYLINDVEAVAWSLDTLPKEGFKLLHAAAAHGNRAVIAPGTGLGEAGLYWDGTRHHPFATEGGHCEFGPRGELQLELCYYLFKRFGHASYERILSGPGLVTLYHFLREQKGYQQREEVAACKDDLAREITAWDGRCPLCTASLDLFVSILGAEASNCVLKHMALGGIFLGGGIVPKIAHKLQQRPFLEGFLDKGRFRSLLENVPIVLILDSKAALHGAAHFVKNGQLIQSAGQIH